MENETNTINPEILRQLDATFNPRNNIYRFIGLLVVAPALFTISKKATNVTKWQRRIIRGVAWKTLLLNTWLILKDKKNADKLKVIGVNLPNLNPSNSPQG
jgi:hypothetical protein